MDKLTLRELKTLVKEHVKSAPKMSSGKQSLLLYADKMGLLKKDIPVEKLVKVEAPLKTEKPIKVDKGELAEGLKKPIRRMSETPEILKAPAKVSKVKAEKVLVATEVSEKVQKKAPTAFAAFISANKGQGMNMSELSKKYRENKSE